MLTVDLTHQVLALDDDDMARLAGHMRERLAFRRKHRDRERIHMLGVGSPVRYIGKGALKGRCGTVIKLNRTRAIVSMDVNGFVDSEVSVPASQLEVMR